MLQVQDLIHHLQVKWMWWLWSDKGQTWSCYFWSQMIQTVPYQVIPGMMYISDAWMVKWNGLFCTFAHLNVLLRNSPQPEDPVPQQNLWASKYNKSIKIPLINAVYIEVGDLPLVNGSIDHIAL